MRLKQMFPKEHGTWAMLLVPWAVGVGVGREFGDKDLLLLVALLAAFLGHTQATNWLRLRRSPRLDPVGLRRIRDLGLLLGTVGLAAALPLVVAYRLTWLVPLGALASGLAAASLLLVYRRKERTLTAQLFAPVGLSVSAAVAYYVARGDLGRAAFALWALSALFLVGGILYVRLKIAALSEEADLTRLGARLALAGPTLGGFFAIVAAAYLVARLGSLSPLVLLAFVPTAAQAVAGVARLDRPANLKRVGLISTAHTIIFALIVIWLA